MNAVLAAPELDAPAAETAPLLAVVEATDRHGSVIARLPVRRWPVNVGRQLDADLVLDDEHVAAQHLRLTNDSAGLITVRVLDTRNGVTMGRRHHGRGEVFAWPVHQQLALGRLHLRARLSASPLAEEALLPRPPWQAAFWSMAAVLAMLLLALGQLWIKSSDTQKLLQELPLALIATIAALALWAGLWALASKLFGGHPQFWRHVRIASLVVVASQGVELCTEVVAFAFSWEDVGRFNYLGVIMVAAFGIYRHLLVVVPQRRHGLAVGVVLALALGMPALLGTQWLKSGRLSNQLYMSQLFPPGWRIAQPVPVSTFLKETENIEQRLAARLKDREDEDAADGADEDDE